MINGDNDSLLLRDAATKEQGAFSAESRKEWHNHNEELDMVKYTSDTTRSGGCIKWDQQTAQSG
jgi:hypothetical protein